VGFCQRLCLFILSLLGLITWQKPRVRPIKDCAIQCLIRKNSRSNHSFSFYLALGYWHRLWEPEDLRSKRVSDSSPNEHVPELRSNRVLIGWILFRSCTLLLVYFMSDNPSKAAVWAWVNGRIVRGGGTWTWAKSGPSRESRARGSGTLVRRAVNLWAGVGDRAPRNGVSSWAVGYTSRACMLLVSSTLYVFYSPLIRDNL